MPQLCREKINFTLETIQQNVLSVGCVIVGQKVLATYLIVRYFLSTGYAVRHKNVVKIVVRIHKMWIYDQC